MFLRANKILDLLIFRYIQKNLNKCLLPFIDSNYDLKGQGFRAENDFIWMNKFDLKSYYNYRCVSPVQMSFYKQTTESCGNLRGILLMGVGSLQEGTVSIF